MAIKKTQPRLASLVHNLLILVLASWTGNLAIGVASGAALYYV